MLQKDKGLKSINWEKDILMHTKRYKGKRYRDIHNKVTVFPITYRKYF